MNRREVLRPFEEHKEYMEERIQTGIELYRKGFADLSIVDKDGNPVENVQVELRQTKHDFLYGANIFMLDELPTEEANQNYKDRYAEIFNEATIPFYWRDNEPEQGKLRFDKDSPKIYRRPAIDLCLEYCEERGITPKAHCLNYQQWGTPKWLPDDVASEKFYLEKRFRELAERYADKIHGWEVTNETLYLPSERTTAFFEEPDLVNWSFKTAERYFPMNELIINDAHRNIWNVFNGARSNYYLQINSPQQLLPHAERLFRSTRDIQSGKLLAQTLKRQFNYNEAITICESLLVLNPTDSDKNETYEIY